MVATRVMHWHSRPLYIRTCSVPLTNMHHKRKYTSNKQVPHSATKAISSLQMLSHPHPTPTTNTCHLPCHMYAPRPPPSTTHTTPPSTLHTTQPTHLMARCCNMGSFPKASAILAAPASPILLSLQLHHAAVKRRQDTLGVKAQTLTTPHYLVLPGRLLVR